MAETKTQAATHEASPAKKIVFISGPMFSPADAWEQGQIKSAVEAAGFATYYAPDDGIEDDELIGNLKSPLIEVSIFQKAALLVQKIGWTLDIYMATSGSDAMVMNMNGRVPDEGSVVEAANAYACGMPLVLYKDTSITMWGPFDNPMVAALTKDWAPVGSYGAIAPALEKAIAAADPAYTYVPPPHFAHDLAIGKFVRENRDQVMAVLLGLSHSITHLQLDIDKLWHWLLDAIGIHAAPSPPVPPAAG